MSVVKKLFVNRDDTYLTLDNGEEYCVLKEGPNPHPNYNVLVSLALTAFTGGLPVVVSSDDARNINYIAAEI